MSQPPASRAPDSKSPAIIPTGSRITDQNLLELHHAYQDFMNAKPWKELNDRNILLFNKTPDSLKSGRLDQDTQASCVVMGHWDLEYGIAGYIGPLGLDTITRIVLGKDGEQPQPARSIAATTGHRSMVRSNERQRMHRMGLKYQGNDNYPVWFAQDPGVTSTRSINDQRHQCSQAGESSRQHRRPGERPDS